MAPPGPHGFGPVFVYFLLFVLGGTTIVVFVLFIKIKPQNLERSPALKLNPIRTYNSRPKLYTPCSITNFTLTIAPTLSLNLDLSYSIIPNYIPSPALN